MKKYQVIYADPPWTFKVRSSKGEGRSAKKHYPVMDAPDIRNLDIPSLASESCVLFMWATAPNLIEAFELIKAWGFVYKTVAFTWIKKNKKKDSLFWGMGYWTRQNAEFCLLATKGTPKRISKSIHSSVVSPIGRHSAKPAEVRDRIAQLMGDVPRIELFARQKTEGWDIWGNELPNDIDLPVDSQK